MTSLHADDAFLSYYQFSHDPFTPRVPGFKFYPAQRKSVLGQLHHLARYGQLLLLVTGPKGSGKTLLRQALVASTNKQAVHSLVLSGREAASRDGVLKQVATGVESASSSVGVILARAGQLALTGQEVYLLVDDAGLLEDEALQVLLALAAGNGEGRIHVFLFAEDDLAQRLAQFADAEESFHTIELQPYSDTETREYLSLRLEGAGQSLDLLTDDQVDEIHAASCGWPGAINQVARETMIDAMLADRGAGRSGGFSASLPKKHLVALLVVCVSVAAAWFMNSDSKISDQPATMTIEQPPADQEASVEFSTATQEQPSLQPAQPVIREPLAQASIESDAEERPAMAAPEMVEELPVIVSVPEERSTAVPLPLPATVTPSESELPATVAPQKTTIESVEKPKAPAVAAAPVVPAEQKPVAPPPAAQKPVAVVAAKPVASAATVPAGSDWYRSQAPGRIALQILGTRSEASAKAFVKQNGGEYRYYMKMHQGTPMYVVTYGVFSSQSAAQAALKGLPAKIQAGKPWPKSFSVIQQEMVKGR
jgi:DamX protein